MKAALEYRESSKGRNEGRFEKEKKAYCRRRLGQDKTIGYESRKEVEWPTFRGV